MLAVDELRAISCRARSARKASRAAARARRDAPVPSHQQEQLPATDRFFAISLVPTADELPKLPAPDQLLTTPNDRNWVHFLCEHGYLVVGVTPREDTVPSTQRDMRFMASWGLEKHSADVRSIVKRLQPTLALPYEILGHSYGAITALDYAARYSGELAPTRVIALDIYVLDPEAEPKQLEDAKRTYDAHVQLLERGTYVDSGYALLKPAKELAVTTPNISSGTSRAEYGHEGTFTFEQLLFATIIDSSRSAGVHGDITKLPGDWLFKGGAAAGRYKFADDPKNDRHAFTLTRYDTFIKTVDAVGSGLIAVALERDVWAVNANVPGYQLDWSAIKQPVVWINSEFGYSKHRHGAALIRASGNAHVLDDELSGYGHGDMLWAETARTDLWDGQHGRESILVT